MTATALSETAREYMHGTTSMLIEDERVQAASGESFPVYDAATGTEIARAPRGSDEDVDRAVAAARRAPKGPWKRVTPQERGKMIWRLADLIEARLEDFSQIDSLDNGKPINEVALLRCAVHGRHAALHGRVADQADRRHDPDLVSGLVRWRLPLLHPPRAGRRRRRHHAFGTCRSSRWSRSSHRRWRPVAP
jgi:acyl-CoA reductase-like NAD-dependent aldehyde dehydrogenase